MGLLDQYDKAKKYAAGLLAQVPQNAQDIYQGLLSAPSQVSDLFSQQKAQQLAKALKNPQQANPKQWMDAGMNLAGMAPVMGLLGHTVYHGSPHKFDAFDMGKIGTGEGAQAYGHGLYFAESPEVADEYAGKLSKAIIQFKNKTPQDEYEKRILEVLQKDADVMQYDSRGYAVRQSYRNFLEPRLWKLDPKNPKANPYNKTVPLEGEELSNVIKYKEAAQRLGDPSVFDSGNFYKVDIPDEVIPRMLDWDKPLSEQPEVWKMLQEKFPYLGNQGHKTGEWALGEIGEGLGGLGPKLTQEMQQAGIPGIRYLDGSSRTAGQGTSNYVLFDDQLPRILEVNGQPTGLKPWKAK